ncbi:MAG TPA: ABC transporter permease [Gemmataceae bacterium]|nr:ABC transporter permease [Gemmataceae bacterium]
MRFADLLGMSFSALWQQKVRTLLTMFGVLIGTFTLVSSISVGRGVYEATMRQLRQGNQLRQVQVSPGYGKVEERIPHAELEVKGPMSAAKRERIRKMIIKDWTRRHPGLPQAPLDRGRLQALADMEHVEAVVPFIHRQARVVFGDKSRLVTASAADSDNRPLRNRIVAGQYFDSDHGRSVVVHEYLLYLWGITSEEQVDDVVGRRLRLEYRTGRRPIPVLMELLQPGRFNLTPDEKSAVEKAIKGLPAVRDKLKLTPAELQSLERALGKLPVQPSPGPAARFSEEFTIAGVMRDPGPGDDMASLGLGQFGWDDGDLLLPVGTAEEFFYPTPKYGRNDVQWATVTVDREENLREVIGRIEGMGLRQWSLVDFADRVRRNMVLMTFVMSFLATVALVVSALGITNTMLMSVLERMHEIGVMKAVGARDVHIQLIFLVEGALIGAMGGGLGLLLSWGASFPGDSVARHIMEQQTQTHLQETLFLFPLWLTLGAPLFASLVTTLAAVYPARRAAKVSPIKALRHE